MNNTTLFAHLIPAVFTLFAICLMFYEKSEARKKVELWISKNIFRDKTETVNTSAERLHNVVLNYVFLFCVAIAGIFIIGLIQ